MKLYCKEGIVLGWHDDAQDVSAAAYGEEVVIIPFTGQLADLARSGPPPGGGLDDLRPYLAPPVDLAHYLADIRWRHETGGITVAGQEIATDRGAQAMIAGAFSLIQAMPDTVIQFKAKAGFVDLTAAQMSAIAIAVAQHVQTCFAIEAEVATQIGSGAITTTAEIDAAFAN